MGCSMYLCLFAWGMVISCIGGGFIVQPREQAPMCFLFGILFLPVAIFLTYYQTKIIPEKKRAEQERKREEKLSEQSKCEREERTLAYLEGLEKFHKMDVADAKAYKEYIKALRLVGTIMQESVYQEKKTDWAIMGGIADGIAGPAAGISVAINTMNENAKIEAENAARREWGRKQNAYYQDLANQAEAKRVVALTMSELQRKYTAIMAWSPDTLFSIINFRSPKIDIDSETGAVTVSVEWAQYDRSLCIDGAIRAKLYSKEGEYAGCAHLVLPKVGTSKFRGILSGICSIPKKASHYDVVLEPINLWELASADNLTDNKNDNLTNEQHQQIVQRYRDLFETENAVLEAQIEEANNKPEPIKEKKSAKDFVSKHKKGFIVVAICIAVIIAVILVVSFVQNAPYRALEESLNSDSFSAEWAIANDHNYIKYDEKAMQIIANQLGKYHQNNDIEKALYTLSELSELEVEIDGKYYYASSNFINWIKNCAKSQGVALDNGNSRVLKYKLYGYTITWDPNEILASVSVDGFYVGYNNTYYNIDSSDKVCIP